MEDKVLVIDRSKWRTGDNGKLSTGKGKTQLLNEEGYMCCLGFECIRNGILPIVLLEIGEPGEINAREGELPNHLVSIYNEDGQSGQYYITSSFSQEAMIINDDEVISRDSREHLITKHFKKEGITVQFINEYE